MKVASAVGLAVLRVTLGVIFLMHGYLGFDIGPAGMVSERAEIAVPCLPRGR